MVEPNQRSIWVGTGLDWAPEERLKLSAQIAVPKALGESGAGAGKETYIVKAAVGKNLEDSFQRMQAKLSRKVFLGQRDAVFIGEELGKHGFRNMLDEFGRNPVSNIRTRLFYIKDTTANSFLKESADLEQFSTFEAIRQTHFNGIRDRMTTMLFFKEVMQRDGMRPILQVISSKTSRKLTQKAEAEGALSIIREIALLNKSLHVVGILQEEEAIAALWASGYLDSQMVTEYMDRGRGLATFDFHHLERQIKSKIVGDTVQISLTISGKGMLDEIDANYDLNQYVQIRELEKEVNEKLKQRVTRVISKVQKEFGTDIFGFGEDVHHRYPEKWKHLKDDWDKRFPQVEVTVQSNIALRHIGEESSQ